MREKFEMFVLIEENKNCHISIHYSYQIQILACRIPFKLLLSIIVLLFAWAKILDKELKIT